MNQTKFRPKIDRVKYGGAVLGVEEVKAVMDVMLNNNGERWTVGPESIAFEEELASKTGVKRAVVVNSGSSALLIALAALKLPKYSIVAIPAVNFPTAFNAILQNELIPCVLDVDPKTLNIDLSELRDAVDKFQISAVIGVNIASNPVDYKQMREIVGPDVKIICDNCVAKGSLVKTDKGDIPIENIKVGDKVLTRKGYKKVLKTMYKGFQPVITRFGVTATPDHKFITTKGKKPLEELKPSDILYLWNETQSSIEEKSSLDIQRLNKSIDKDTIGLGQSRFIGISGNAKKETSQKGCGSTTLTETFSTIILKTFNLLHPKNILNTTLKRLGDLRQHLITWTKQELQRLNGISLIVERSFMPSTTNGFGLLGNDQQIFARSVNLNTRPTGLINQSIARESANHLAEVYDLTVEDAHEFFANNVLVSNCDGYGTLVDGVFVDTLADVSCVSFHAAHIITTGEGGACLTNDEELADRIKKMREWGRADGTDDIYKYPGFPEDYRSRYVYEEIGYNMKPLELQCAMGRVQLKKLEAFREARLANHKKLKAVFEKYPQFELIQYPENAQVCWFSFPFYCKGIPRKMVMDKLEENNIECRTIFSGNILRHPAYSETEYVGEAEYPHADRVMREGMFLSVHPSITDEMITFIDQVLDDICKSYTE